MVGQQFMIHVHGCPLMNLKTRKNVEWLATDELLIEMHQIQTENL